MAMTKSEVRRAFRTAMAADYAHVPAADDVTHTFSSAFLEKMAALLAKERRSSWQLLSRQRRALVVAAILAAALLLTACSPTLRQAVTEFVVSVYERFVDYEVKTELREEIETIYVLYPVPEGLELVSQTQQTAYLVETVYVDNQGKKIKFSQATFEDMSGITDNERSDTSVIEKDGTSFLVYSSEKVTTVSWIFDGYYMELSYFAPMDTDQILSLVASLAPMEQGGLSDGND